MKINKITGNKKKKSYLHISKEAHNRRDITINIKPNIRLTNFVAGAILCQMLDFSDSKSKDRLEMRLSSSSNELKAAASRDDKALLDC